MLPHETQRIFRDLADWSTKVHTTAPQTANRKRFKLGNPSSSTERMQVQDAALQPLDNISNISESHMLLPSGEGLKQGSAKSKGGGAGGGAGGGLAAERAMRRAEVEEQIKENRGMRFRQIMDHLVSAPSPICHLVFPFEPCTFIESPPSHTLMIHDPENSQARMGVNRPAIAQLHRQLDEALGDGTGRKLVMTICHIA
jgi:hypothetical protein